MIWPAHELLLIVLRTTSLAEHLQAGQDLLLDELQAGVATGGDITERAVSEEEAQFGSASG